MIEQHVLFRSRNFSLNVLYIQTKVLLSLITEINLKVFLSLNPCPNPNLNHNPDPEYNPNPNPNCYCLPDSNMN